MLQEREVVRFLFLLKIDVEFQTRPMADYTLLDLIPSFAHHEHAPRGWSEVLGGARPVFKETGPILMAPVAFAALVLVIMVIGALIARTKYKSAQTAILPEGHLTVRNVFEGIFDAIYNMMAGMMGPQNARRYFPLIATLGLFILGCNLLGLVPGFLPPTQSLNTNLAMGLTVFVFYNVVGLMEQGPVNYFKHFAGPMLALAPLMLVIELISHCIRPLSLSLRLAGNMTGDHTVLGVFGQIAADLFGGLPLLLPVPFLFLGLLVSVIQTIVFCMLSSIYIAMAVHHEEHH